MTIRRTPLDAWMVTKTDGVSLPDRQLSLLNETIYWALQRSAFYKKHLSQVSLPLTQLEDLSSLPFTSADDIRATPLKFVCVSQDAIQRVVTLETSGTTGEPKRVYFTAEDQDLTIDFFGVGMSTLTELAEKVIIFLPGQLPNSVGDLLYKGLARVGRSPIAYGPIKDPLDALEKIAEHQPDCMVGSPTQLLGLARRWKPTLKPPRTVLLSTDHLPNAITKVLEDTWGCQVFNHYGATEMGLGGGVDCEAHNGYHMREADLYFEIVDPQTGNQLPVGEYGEVVFTTLTRVGMPLIRYRTGDKARFLPGNCDCGSSLRRMETIRGRYSGIIQLQNNTIWMPDLDELLFDHPNVLNFTASVGGTPDREVLRIDVKTLHPTDGEVDLLQKLSRYTKTEIDLKITCDPAEPGSLRKRAIIDQRGNYA